MVRSEGDTHDMYTIPDFWEEELYKVTHGNTVCHSKNWDLFIFCTKDYFLIISARRI